MERRRSITLKVELPYYPHELSPQDVSKYMEENFSAGVTRRQWIPQTLGDQVWIWYEYETTQRRDEVFAALAENVRKFSCDFSQSDLEYWKDIDGTDGSF